MNISATAKTPFDCPAISAGMHRLALLSAIRSGLTYANGHSTICSSGEIRGQVEKGGRR
jgi:hypothetical protein